MSAFLQEHPRNEEAWHILSFALTDPDKQAYALRRVLQINPRNRAARSQLARLQAPAPAAAPRVAPIAAPARAPAPTPAPAEERPRAISGLAISEVAAVATATGSQPPRSSLYFLATAEQALNPESRVRLGRERDPLGMPRVE